MKFFCVKWLNPRWQNSSWQNSSWWPSLSFVRRNEFEADWNSLSQSFVQNGWIQDGRIKDGRIQDGCHHQVRWEGMSLSQIEKITRVSIQDGSVWIQHGRIQDGCHHQVNQIEWVKYFVQMVKREEWVKFFFFLEMVGTNIGKCELVWEEKQRWLNPRWPNSRWLPSSSWVRMKEFESDWISLSQSFVQNGWIQDGRIQDGCHHQVSQIEWVKYFVQMVKEEGVKFFFFGNGGNQSWQVWSLRGKTKIEMEKLIKMAGNSSWQNSSWWPSLREGMSLRQLK